MKSITPPQRPLSARRDARLTMPEPDVLAAQILTFLAGDDERLNRFFALTGIDHSSLREAAAAGNLSEAVLSYLGSDENLLVAFASETSLAPETVGRVILAATAPQDTDA